jgi:hypothetical protein
VCQGPLALLRRSARCQGAGTQPALRRWARGLPGRFRHFHADSYGNRDFVEHLRNRGKFFDHEEGRERDLILIDYEAPSRNVFEVTEEWPSTMAATGRERMSSFSINGIPVLVIECKNANKDEAIALGVDQIRRDHPETPELFAPEQLFTATNAIGFSYGVPRNTVRRNIFTWKHDELGKLEAKVKGFCAIPQMLAFMKDYIVFAEKDEERISVSSAAWSPACSRSASGPWPLTNSPPSSCTCRPSATSSPSTRTSMRWSPTACFCPRAPSRCCRRCPKIRCARRSGASGSISCAPRVRGAKSYSCSNWQLKQATTVRFPLVVV